MASVAELLGTTIVGRYRVVGLLGEGGMGTVYEVQHLPTGRSLALKRLPPEMVQVDAIGRRFEREAKAASLLDHPNIIEVLDYGVLDGALFLVMELVRGLSLGELIERGPVALARTISIALQTLSGLAYIHERGMIHRDLKPDNVMLVTSPTGDHVKLVDFGLVKLVGEVADDIGGGKLTETGITFGTPDYMAPEQALGRPVDARTDLYALGVILFEMLSGRRPFVATDPMALLRQQVGQLAPRLASHVGNAAWCTPELDDLIARALQKRPDDRFASAAEMSTALTTLQP